MDLNTNFWYALLETILEARGIANFIEASEDQSLPGIERERAFSADRRKKSLISTNGLEGKTLRAEQMIEKTRRT